jgi:hypothetical protein
MVSVSIYDSHTAATKLAVVDFAERKHHNNVAQCIHYRHYPLQTDKHDAVVHDSKAPACISNSLVGRCSRSQSAL